MQQKVNKHIYIQTPIRHSINEIKHNNCTLHYSICNFSTEENRKDKTIQMYDQNVKPIQNC